MIIRAKLEWGESKKHFVDHVGWERAHEAGVLIKHYTFDKDSIIEEYGSMEAYKETDIREVYEANHDHVNFEKDEVILSAREAIECSDWIEDVQVIEMPERFLSIDDVERLRGYAMQGKHQTDAVNQKVNVRVSDNLLLQVDVVKVEENLCTDTLQEQLDDGWKILAICPQPDQRRPDYILGKSTNGDQS